MGKAFDAIADCAEIIDATDSWQVIYGKGHKVEDQFELHVASRGAIPRLSEGSFGDISDSIVVEVNPDDISYNTAHIVKYVGELAGMQMFTEILSKNLASGAEGNVDVVARFTGRNPFWGLRL